MNQLLKKVYPHVVAILVFIGLSAAYFSPVLEGYKLRQGDIKNWQGMSKEIIDFNETADAPTLWTNSMFGGMPAYQISVKYTSNLTAKIYTFFKLGLNRPIDNVFLYMAGFYLLLISFGVSPWLAIVGAIAYAFSSYYIVIIEAGHMSKAAASAYMAPVFASLVYAFKRQKRWLGAGLFTLFLSLQLYCNHLQVTYYLAFMVGVYCIYELMNSIKEKQLNRFLITSSLLIVGASFALLANSGNLFGTVEYGEYTTRGKSELTINANGQSNETNKTEGLNRDYVTAWSYGQQETFTYLIPNAKGGATGRIGANAKALTKASPAFRKNIAQSNQYWGNQTFTSGPVYLGAIICLLFVLGLVLLPGKLKWYLLGVGVLATLLGWGKNLMWLTDMFLDYMPGYNKFRTVTIILILVQLIVPLIGILWLKDLIDRTAFYQVNKKKVLYTLLSFSGVLLVISLAPATFFDFLSNAELAQWDQLTASGQGAGASQFFAELAQVRVALFKSDAFRSLGFVLVSGALIWFFIGGKLTPIYLIVSLGLLVLIDMWNVDKRYLNNDKTAGKYQKWEKKIDYSLPYQPGAADQGILRNELIENPSLNTQIQERLTWKQNEAKKEGEILKQKNKANIPFEALNLNSNYRVLTLGNPFNESNTSYFHKSIGGYHGAKMKRYQELIDFHISSEMQQLVTYLQSGISVDSMQKQFVNLKVLNMLNTKYYVYNRDAAPLKNMARYGNAWFVNSVKWAANANEEILSLNQTDLKNVVVIDERFKTLVPEMIMDTTATISMTSYKPNELIYQSSTQKEQFVVFSEIHYDKGWNAYIDNQLVPHVRVNYLLRGLTIPAGEHTILFKFEPKSFKISSNLAILGNIGVILLFGFSLFKEWKSSTTEA